VCSFFRFASFKQKFAERKEKGSMIDVGEHERRMGVPFSDLLFYIRQMLEKKWEYNEAVH
jgi:hypothetical protein